MLVILNFSLLPPVRRQPRASAQKLLEISIDCSLIFEDFFAEYFRF